MKAALSKKGDVYVVSIIGKLEIEDTQPFREACLQKLNGQKVIFNMEKAAFVGSTGLQPFLDVIRQMDQGSEHGVRLVGVQPEFRRLIGALETQRVSFHEDVNTAMVSFTAVSRGDFDIT